MTVKLLCSILFLLTFNMTCFGQPASSKSYRLKVGQFLPKFDITSQRAATETKLVKDTYYFQVVSEASGGYVIWLFEFIKDEEYDGQKGDVLNKLFFVDSTTNAPIYYYITQDIWSKYVEEVTKDHGITFGITNVPIKLRFSNSNPKHRPRDLELEGNINLGLSVAYYWKLADESLIFAAAGITLTQIKIDARNTLDYVSQTENRSGFSYFTGLIYQKDGYQIGLLAGADCSTGDVSHYWVYQKKLWVGIGIGISIFQPNNRPVKSQASGS